MMNRSVFSIIVVALIGHLCVAEIVIETLKPKHLTKLYDAAVDVLMTCYGDVGNAIGIRGDSNGYIFEALRLKYFIPVVLTELTPNVDYSSHSNLHELQVFVIAVESTEQAANFMIKLTDTMWWNQYANFLFIDASLNRYSQCANYATYTYIPYFFGVLNAQFVCCDDESGVLMYTSNPFTTQAPPVWEFVTKLKGVETNFSVFMRRYRKGGQTCEALNFPKTIDIGGSPIRFLSQLPSYLYDINHPSTQEFVNMLSDLQKESFKATIREKVWFRDNIVKALNATAVIVHYEADSPSRRAMMISGVMIAPTILTSQKQITKEMTRTMIFPLANAPVYALTKHTSHKSQLTKIFSVIDENSRIGMSVVYLISFLFFKFFLGQAVMPALLNIVRLTCNTGLPKLPQNLAPTIYLACLFMFVVTLQAIYTGNLATLLTTTVAYRNVETKRDIPYLGYTVYVNENSFAKFLADPSLHGHVTEIPKSANCVNYVLKEPLAACVFTESTCVYHALRWNLHISRDPMMEEHFFYIITGHNPLGRRLESIIRRWGEHGLQRKDRTMSKLRLMFLKDDEVKKNTFRRVMTVHDLCFAFVILGVGLLCSFICFIGEILICKIRLNIAKRRNRVRARLAWGVKEHSYLSLPSLSFRFNARRLFSKRR